jgi:hypothetical protein
VREQCHDDAARDDGQGGHQRLVPARAGVDGQGAQQRQRAASNTASVPTSAMLGATAASIAAVPATQPTALNRQVARRPCRTRNVRLPNTASVIAMAIPAPVQRRRGDGGDRFR